MAGIPQFIRDFMAQKGLYWEISLKVQVAGLLDVREKSDVRIISLHPVEISNNKTKKLPQQEM